jgi:hypothetical protein
MNECEQIETRTRSGGNFALWTFFFQTVTDGEMNAMSPD